MWYTPPGALGRTVLGGPTWRQGWWERNNKDVDLFEVHLAGRAVTGGRQCAPAKARLILFLEFKVGQGRGHHSRLVGQDSPASLH